MESRWELGLERELELARGWEWEATSVGEASKWVSEREVGVVGLVRG